VRRAARSAFLAQFHASYLGGTKDTAPCIRVVIETSHNRPPP
jgi:hypothetical protein